MLPSEVRKTSTATDRIQFVDGGGLPCYLSRDVGQFPETAKCWLGAGTVICIDRHLAKELAAVFLYFAEKGAFPPGGPRA